MQQAIEPEVSTNSSLPGWTTPVQWSLPASLSQGDWMHYVSALLQVERSCRWWIGDALNYGEVIYGETYSQLAEETGYKVTTLQTMKWVSKKIPPELRRESVDYSLHREVAGLESLDDIDRWLEFAEETGCSRAELRAAIRRHKPDHNRLDAPKPAQGWKMVEPDETHTRAEPDSPMERLSIQVEKNLHLKNPTMVTRTDDVAWCLREIKRLRG